MNRTLVALALLWAGCSSAHLWQNEQPPSARRPGALKPTSLLQARTAECLARKGKDGYFLPNRIDLPGGTCLCDLTYCGGTPWRPEYGSYEGQPLNDTGLGLGRYVCSSVGGSRAADELGCPLQQPEAGEPCLERWGRLGITCLYLHGETAQRMACRGTTWVALPGRCDPNLP